MSAPTYLVGGIIPVGPRGQTVVCPSCQSNVKTKTSTTHKLCTHFLCALMCCSGICTLCCCLPYCVLSPDSVEHKCPVCNTFIGVYHG